MDSFDAYYHWLGIPPEEQPPDHYRLLGLRRFEDNPTVISHAADRQMAHLRTFQTGRHSAESQRLLNETAAARVCLLNPDKKAAYDKGLRASIERQTRDASGREPPGEEAPETAEAGELVEFAGEFEPVSRARITAGRQAGRRPLVFLVAIIAVAAAVGVLGWSVIRSHRPVAEQPVEHESEPFAPQVPRPAIKPVPQPVVEPSRMKPPTETTKPTPAQPKPELPKPERPKPERPKPTTEPTLPSPETPKPEPSTPPVAPPASAAPEDTGPTPRPTVERPAQPSPVEPTKPTPPSPTIESPTAPPELGPPSKPAKSPAPPTDAQRRIAAALNEIYTFSANRTPAETDALIAELLKHGQRLEGTADERFVVLRKAMEVATAAGRTDPTLQAIDLLDEHYEIDPWSLRHRAFKQMAAQVKGPGAARSLLSTLERVLQEALDADRYAAAEELAKAGNRASMEADDVTTRKKWKESYAATSRLCRKAEKIREIEKHLETSPDDLAAHDDVGHWYCFEREDWRRGLPHLANGTNATLAELAESELRRKPASADEQVRLADAWWDFAAKARKNQRDAIRRHAARWYRLAMPELTGVAKLKVEKQLATLAHEPDQSGARRRPKRSYRCRFAVLADDQFEMCVNGTPFVGGNRSQTLVSQMGALASGDVITVRAVNAGGPRGFVCAILSEEGDLIVTGPAWRSYYPKSPDQWQQPDQMDRLGLVLPGNASLAQRFLQQTRVQAASIWGTESTCYLVYRIP